MFVWLRERVGVLIVPETVCVCVALAQVFAAALNTGVHFMPLQSVAIGG